MNVHGGKAESRGSLRLGYRADVDGLRAVAVLLVFADHLHTRFTGGYVGVDVFFVISGYLISAVILSELVEGRFSIVNFYERRIRRIFPAMLVMFAAVTVLVYRFFVPSEMESYARSLLAALFSGSNFLFWHESGYFDAPSAVKPLLHTWSLGVEEQFYILFPLFLVAVVRFYPKRLKAAIVTIAGISFLAAALTVRHSPVAAFFFAPLRAWELLAGTIISQRYLPVPRGAVLRNFASAAGLMMIVAPAMLYNSKTPFPGLAALPPCLGAALIIAAGETGSSVVGRILSWRPVVFVGLISYSLYLWHWPLIVFQNTSSLLFPGVISNSRCKLLIAVVAFAIATISWAFVEQPFRKGRFRPGRRMVFAANGIALALMTVVGGCMLFTQGLPGRFPAKVRDIAAFTTYDEHAAYREGVCFIGPAYTFANFQPQTCFAQHAGRRSVLVAGDSHAAQLWPGLSAVFPDRDILEATEAGCPPVLRPIGAAEADCKALFSFLYFDYLERNHVDTLLLSARWAPYMFDALDETVAFARAHGIEVVLVGPTIEYDTPMPRVIATALRDSHPERIEPHRSTEPQNTDRTMSELARTRWHVPYISIYDNLCKPACPLYATPGVPLLFDTDHFTAAGSELLAHAIRERDQLP